jgi:copper chaperone CopZ
MKTATFSMDGMHCDGCARTIEALVGGKSGVHKVEASFPARQTRIFYDPKIFTEESLVAVIETSGFRVKPGAS